MRLVTVYRTTDPLEAQVLRALLGDAEIPCVLKGWHAHNLDPLLLSAEIEVQVPVEHEAEALRLLEGAAYDRPGGTL